MYATHLDLSRNPLVEKHCPKVFAKTRSFDTSPYPRTKYNRGSTTVATSPLQRTTGPSPQPRTYNGDTRGILGVCYPPPPKKNKSCKPIANRNYKPHSLCMFLR